MTRALCHRAAKQPPGSWISRRDRLLHVLGRAEARPSRSISRAKDQAIDQEQEHRAHDGADESRRLAGLVPFQRVPEIRSDERSCDADQNREDAAAGIAARHEKFRDRADQQSDYQRPDD
jgi:hypothetical protein